MKQLMKQACLFTLALLLMFLSSCRDITDNPIYHSPDWLDGKIYTLISENDSLKTFAAMLQKTEWADILDRSGFFTVFAPTDEAFKQFFAESPDYNSIEDFDSLTLDNIIRYHIIDDGWSKDQLRSLTYTGFVDENSEFYNEPKAFKRQTLYRDQTKTIYVKIDPYGEQDEIKRTYSASYSERLAIPDTRKYVPIFFQEYMDIEDYTSDDYSFYFGRDFEGGREIYYANAKVVGDERFAENGFVYMIDEVVPPMPNLEQALLNTYDGRSYTDFLDLIYRYPSLTINTAETNAQPGALEGKDVPNLYDISYPYFPVDIDNERTGYSFGSSLNLSLSFHPTLLAPTNSALKTLIDEYVTNKRYDHYSSFEEADDAVKQLIVGSYMTPSLTMFKEFNEGFLNSAYDTVLMDVDDIADKMFCSNGVFIGFNKPIVPRAFTSVAGPIWLRPGYEAFRLAMLGTGLMQKIKNANNTYTLLVVDDGSSAKDSSLLIEKTTEIGIGIRKRLYYYDMSESPAVKKYWSSSALGAILMNHICLGQVDGTADFEYLRTISGNYVKFDNVTGEVQGSSASTFGINGDSGVYLYPEPLQEPTDNGVVFNINSFLSFGASGSLFAKVRLIGREGEELNNYFVRLCIAAGLADDNGFYESFIAEGNFHTAFIPTDKALHEYEEEQGINLMTLDATELANFLKYHIVNGDIIFTDGKKQSGEYNTLREDPSSSDFYKVYSKLNLDLGFDNISILNASSESQSDISPYDRNVNQITYTRRVDNTIEDPNNTGDNILTYATGVVHQINTVLVYSK